MKPVGPVPSIPLSSGHAHLLRQSALTNTNVLTLT